MLMKIQNIMLTMHENETRRPDIKLYPKMSAHPLCIYIYIYMCVCVLTYVRLYAHTYIHAYIYIYAYIIDNFKIEQVKFGNNCF